MEERNGFLKQLGQLKLKQVGYEEDLAEAKKFKATTDIFSGLSSIGAEAIDYSLLKTENLFTDIKADQLEVQAQEQANLLRENFNYAIGTEVATAAARGVKVGTGSAAKSLEIGSKNLGEDVKTLKKNASKKAQTLRNRSKMNKGFGRAKLTTGLITGAAKAYGGYNDL